MEIPDEVRQQAVKEYFRDAIRETVDKIENLDSDDLGLDLDSDDLRERLEPLIVSRELQIYELEYVNSLLEDIHRRMEEWCEFRENIASEVDGIIAAATPDPDEEEVAA